MRGTWNTGLNIFKVPIRMDWTFLLWALLIWSFPYNVGLQVFIVLIFSILFHEFAHVLMARKLGFETESVTLSIFGGAAKIPVLPFMKPKSEIIVSAIGPISSFVLSAIGFIFYSSIINPPKFIEFMYKMNLLLGIFNALPLYPMDGGKVLRGILSCYIGKTRGTRVAINVAIILGCLLMGISICMGMWLAAIVFLTVVISSKMSC